MGGRSTTLRTSARGQLHGHGSAVLLMLSLLLVALVALGGATTTDPGWYAALDRPTWAPSASVFGPVWTVLYAAMAIAAWRVGRGGLERPGAALALLAYVQQLALNAAWTPVFFGLHAPGWALAVIVALDLVVLLTVVLFVRVERLAGVLLLPYLGWSLFATALNAAIVL